MIYGGFIKSEALMKRDEKGSEALI